MKTQRFEIPGLAQYSYVVSSEGKAVVIDAMRDIDRYLAYASEQGLRITHVVETHIHADFAAGSTALAEATGAELALSAYDQGEHYQYAMPHRALRNGEWLEIGALRLQALHTPGHTPEHLSFVLFDKKRSESEPVALFSGDFLFVGSLGRPDLLGEEAKRGLAHELFCSLHERIAYIPDSVQVYPGHGAGSFCGSGISERAETTLGYERRTNLFLQLKESVFIAEILASVPPMPRYYPRMKEINAKGAPNVTNLPGNTSFSPKDLEARLQQGDVVVLDLRSPEAFGGAHIPGALNIGAGQNLSLWAGWMLDPSKEIVLVNDCGDDEASRRGLVRVGIDRILGHLAKGMPAWIDAGLSFARTTQLSADEVLQNALESQIVDVRSESEWKAGHIADAKHIPLGDLVTRMNELSTQRPVTIVCGSGYRSSIAASVLAQHGFANVSSMNGGMIAWRRREFPVVLSTSAQATN
jgi:hydroxyacylglutathione hydrolase